MSVTRVAVSSQPKIDAAATMNSTVAVVSIVSIDTLTSILNVSVRYQTSPRNSAQIDAATAPSVGVKMPRRHAADQQHRRHDRQHRLELEFPVGGEQQRPSRRRSRADRIGAEHAPRPRSTSGNAMTISELDDRLAHARPLELDVGAPVVLVRVSRRPSASSAPSSRGRAGCRRGTAGRSTTLATMP